MRLYLFRIVLIVLVVSSMGMKETNTAKPCSDDDDGLLSPNDENYYFSPCYADKFDLSNELFFWSLVKILIISILLSCYLWFCGSMWDREQNESTEMLPKLYWIRNDVVFKFLLSILLSFLLLLSYGLILLIFRIMTLNVFRHWWESLYYLRNYVFDPSKVSGGSETGEFVYDLDSRDVILEVDGEVTAGSGRAEVLEWLVKPILIIMVRRSHPDMNLCLESLEKKHERKDQKDCDRTIEAIKVKINEVQVIYVTHKSVNSAWRFEYQLGYMQFRQNGQLLMDSNGQPLRVLLVREKYISILEFEIR